MKKNKGFTLIELLVVIAIIGILASVVLASLNSARNKGADAAVKSNLANARAQAEIFYDSNGNTYTNVCSNGSTASGDSTIKSIYTHILGASKAVGNTNPGTSLTTAQTTTGNNSSMCHASATGWAASVPLKNGNATDGLYYCVDSSGNASQTSTLLLANITLCS